MHDHTLTTIDKDKNYLTAQSVNTVNSDSGDAVNERQSADQLETSAQLINDRIDPPAPVKASDIHVRSMRLISDQINDYGGRFDSEGIESLRELVLDSPVLVGHRKDKLPIGRVFDSAISQYNGETWLTVRFYWLKSVDGSETLRDNIDGGVYKECSLGFTFRRAECSVCGSDIRSCQHTPTTEAERNSESQLPPHYIYKDIVRALEISLVFRGATPRTRIGAQLGFAELGSDDRNPGDHLAGRLYIPEDSESLEHCTPGDTISLGDSIGRTVVVRTGKHKAIRGIITIREHQEGRR